MEIKPIVEGLVNSIVKSNDIELLANKRKDICDKCEYNNFSTPNRCKVCGCIIHFKVRQSIQKCPKGKW